MHGPGPKSEERTIGDNTYRVTQLVSKDARPTLIRLFKLLGPSIGQMVEDAMAGRSINPDIGVGVAISQLADRISEDDLERLIDTLVQNKTLARKTENGWPLLDKAGFDVHFTGRIGEMFKVLAFALEVNFQDFLGGLRSAAQSLFKGKGTSASPSPQT